MVRRWLLAVSMLVGCGDDPDPLQVTLDTGVIRGIEQGEIRAFRGIPYAAPTGGENRFRPPQPVAPWTGVRETITPGIQCPQSFSLSGPGGEEECLFLNVWAPYGDEPKPVMVWLHGGAFVFGSGSEAYYTGRHLAERYGVVVVTLSYRLGAFGFLAHPAFAAEDPAYPSSGNWGLDDQRAALAWVQRNIRAFGGDPARVTLFGESAGGFSTCAHYVSPRSAGLFQAAISQSGLCASTVQEPTQAEAQAAGVMVAEQLGCPGTGPSAAACLRGKSVDELLDATSAPPPAQQPTSGGPFYAAGTYLATLPNVDGFVLERSLRDAFAVGDFEPRPLIVGANRDEGTLFLSTIFAKPVADEADYRAAIGRRFGSANVDAIAARYPAAAYPTLNAALAEVTGDAFFVCPARRTARGAAAAGAPVYYYSFQRLPAQPFLVDLGVFHSAELPFLFATDPAFPLARVGPDGESTAEAMRGYWTRFAFTGDPNGAGAPAWPTYEGDRHLVLDAAPAAGTAYKASVCDFWDAL